MVLCYTYKDQKDQAEYLSKSWEDPFAIFPLSMSLLDTKFFMQMHQGKQMCLVPNSGHCDLDVRMQLK